MARSERSRRKQQHRQRHQHQRQLRSNAAGPLEPVAAAAYEKAEPEPLASSLRRHVCWRDAFLLLVAGPVLSNACTAGLLVGLCYFLDRIGIGVGDEPQDVTAEHHYCDDNCE